MTAKVFEAALGIAAPWSVGAVDFYEAARTLTVRIDFTPGARFTACGHEGAHPVHDTVTKTWRHLNFFQHEYHLQMRTPRVKLPNGSVRLVEPDFAGRLSGLTLRFEALILMLAQQMPFAAVARIVGESAHRVLSVCERYMDIALGLADFSQTRQTNGFLEAINGLFQAVKRRARGFGRLSTIKTVIFLIAGKLDFHSINPHARQPT